MHGTVLYDRAKLVECGGFDPDVDLCEDYDMLIRMARRHRFAGNSSVIAEYRIHGGNISSNALRMLNWALKVQERHRPSPDDREGWRAYRRGKQWLTRTYALAAWKGRAEIASRAKWKQRWEMTRQAPLTSIAAAGWEFARRRLSNSQMLRLKRLAGRAGPPPGKVDMGDLKRIRPISRTFGYDRGTPIDRHYIEGFLAASRGDIAGRVLEIGDDTYSRRFGSGITQQDVLHIDPDNRQATIAGDLSQAGVLPADAFDCMIVTQTLHLIYDMKAAIAEMHRALRPGGVLLLTAPGVASVDRGEWGGTWYWSLTGVSATRLFEDAFGTNAVEVSVHGNVYAVTCFLQGMAVEEIERDWLDRHDPSYPMVIALRARKAQA